MKNKHYAAIYSLLALSVALLLAYFGGLFTVRLSILDSLNQDNIQPLNAGDVIAKLDLNDTKLESRCTILSKPSDAHCGATLLLQNPDSPETGIDFSKYDSFNIGITPKHNFADPRVKITFRHFDPTYSSLDDPTSNKYNSVLLDLDHPKNTSSNNEQQIYKVPFHYFQVDSWWIGSYDIRVQDAQVDLSNIVSIEFVNRKVEETGQYDFEISVFEVVGEKVTLTQVLSVVLLIAALIIFLLIDEKRKAERSTSLIDPLTKLHNRRGQTEWLKSLKISPNIILSSYLLFIWISTTLNTLTIHLGITLATFYCKPFLKK